MELPRRTGTVCLLLLSLFPVMAATICMNLLLSVDVEESAHSERAHPAEISFVRGVNVDG